MPKIPEKPRLEDWQRYFAIEFNNRAWDLLGKTRSEEEDQELLHCSHASALHWQSAGEELHWMRGKMLLAAAHAAVGLGDSALKYALEMRTFFRERETPDWELAFTEAIYAQALVAAGDQDGWKAAYQAADNLGQDIADPEDRTVFEDYFSTLPAP